MGKRFTDSEKFGDPWYRKLSPAMKCFWEFMLARCDRAGVWEPDWESVAFHVGEDIAEADALDAMDDRVETLASGKWWIRGFCAYQYGALSHDCKPHRPVLKTVEQHGLSDRLVNGLFESKGIGKGTPKGIDTLEEKDREEEKEKDKEEEKDSAPVAKSPTTTTGFMRWWARYPGKTTEKPRCRGIWAGKSPLKDGRKMKLEPLADEICAAVDRQDAARHHEYSGRLCWPNAPTWLYNARWEDDVKGIPKTPTIKLGVAR